MSQTPTQPTGGSQVGLQISGNAAGLAAAPYNIGQGGAVDLVDGAGTGHHFLTGYQGAAGAPKRLMYKTTGGAWQPVISNQAAFVYGMYGAGFEDVNGVGATISADFLIRTTATAAVSTAHGFLTGISVTMPGSGGGNGSGGGLTDTDVRKIISDALMNG